jgi:hypothetical protein
MRIKPLLSSARVATGVQPFCEFARGCSQMNLITPPMARPNECAYRLAFGSRDQPCGCLPASIARKIQDKATTHLGTANTPKHA